MAIDLRGSVKRPYRSDQTIFRGTIGPRCPSMQSSVLHARYMRAELLFFLIYIYKRKSASIINYVKIPWLYICIFREIRCIFDYAIVN